MLPPASTHRSPKRSPLPTREDGARRPTLPSLTGLRFVAALQVVLFHVVGPRLAAAAGPGPRLILGGYVGVSLFFVLSGFILAYTYVGEDGRLRGTAAAFWVARLARVYPVYLLALAVGAPHFLDRVIRHTPPGTSRARDVVAGVLSPVLAQAWWPQSACDWNCPGWSLSVEVLFYALFPLLGMWLARRPSPLGWGVSAWLLSLGAPVLYVLTAPDGLVRVAPADDATWITTLKYFPPAHVGEFALGIVCGCVFLKRRRRPTPGAVPQIAAWLSLCGVAGTLALGDRVPYPLLHNGLLAPCFAAIIYALAIGVGPLARLLAVRQIVRLGEASYALYLLHVPVRNYIQTLGHVFGVPGRMTPVLDMATIAVAIATSVVVFDRVEEPARRAIRSLTTRPASVGDAPTPCNARDAGPSVPIA